MARKPTYVLDINTLPEEARDAWHGLIGAKNFTKIYSLIYDMVAYQPISDFKKSQIATSCFVNINDVAQILKVFADKLQEKIEGQVSLDFFTNVEPVDSELPKFLLSATIEVYYDSGRTHTITITLPDPVLNIDNASQLENLLLRFWWHIQFDDKPIEKLQLQAALRYIVNELNK